MAARLDVTIRTLEHDRTFVGLARTTTEERLFEDAPHVARDFAAVKESLPHRVMPVTTAVVTFDAGKGVGGRAYAAEKCVPTCGDSAGVAEKGAVTSADKGAGVAGKDTATSADKGADASEKPARSSVASGGIGGAAMGAAEKDAPPAAPQPLPFDYFMGDEIEPSRAAVERALSAAEGLSSVTFPAGTLVAVVPVPFGIQATVPMKAAAIRARFFGEWLSQNGYRSADGLGFKDVEVYHYRRRRFRKATKMVMELMFPIERGCKPV